MEMEGAMPYWVYGKDLATAQPRDPIFLEVDSEAEARTQATEAGMSVEEVEFVAPPAQAVNDEGPASPEDPKRSVERKCPDCGGAMAAIEILDKTVATLDLNLNIVGMNFPEQSALEYAVPEAKRSWWTGSLPVAGKVAACMCGSCGRILLFGEPHGG
jgi:hypothetical protein